MNKALLAKRSTSRPNLLIISTTMRRKVPKVLARAINIKRVKWIKRKMIRKGMFRKLRLIKNLRLNQKLLRLPRK
jgi:hypothetical protein